MIFDDAALERYSRQIVLKEIGGVGQRRLAEATVTLIGAGGIGAPALLYLAAAGVGTIRLIEDDVVSLANLGRQILYATDDVGAAKAGLAAAAVSRLNPGVRFVAINERLDATNAAKLIAQCDLVIDGSDNFATRLSVSDHCNATRIPLVSAAVGQFQAQIATFRGWEPSKPCYRCYVGDAFDSDDCDSCSELGVLGAMTGIAGCWAALEAIREITRFGPDPAGKLHLIDGIAPSMRTLTIAKDPACRTCGGLN